MNKPLNLSDFQRDLTEGKTGQEKIHNLTEALVQMVKHVRPYEIAVETDENTVAFDLIGDTQIGSLYQRLDALTKFYAYCRNEGIQTVLHTGDVLDGWKVYKGQEFELHPHGRSWSEQIKMFENGVPRYSEIETIFVTGNHDASFKNAIGMVPGDEIQKVRPDWKFIGTDSASVVLMAPDGQKLRVQLIHPGGGTAYAVSYRAQKIVESLPGGQKPDIIGIGHFHKAEFMPSYRNVAVFQTGCFQDQTPFMVRHSLAAHVGGWIVRVPLNDRKFLTGNIDARFIKFFEEDKR